MARKVEVKLLDDIDGGDADETVRFSLDGTSYEIDVSAKRADELRASLWQFIENARRVGRGGISVPRRGRSATPSASAGRAHNREIREWARRRKIQLSDYGRIPREIVERYELESGR